MKFTIAYLYYDLLNLYGENGNVKILKKQLENQGINVTIKFLSLNDELNFSSYDLVYIGAGTERNQKLALNHLLNYKEDVKKAIENNKFFLITGNAIELFGEYIIDKNNKKYNALNIFNFYAKEENFRLIDEAIFKFKDTENYVIGFQNQSSVIRNLHDPVFEVIKGIGSNNKDMVEGIKYKNFFGTYLIGPLLARNPHILKDLIQNLIKSKKPNFKLQKIDLSLETKAYNMYLKNNLK